jgi:FAD/FMN-containing dehydrogenase
VIPVDSIRTRIKGRVIEPTDPDYDDARTVLVGGIDRRPSLIVRPADATDVAEAIGLAQDNGLELAVRSGGHSATGFGVTDGGLVIDLRDMRAIAIDTNERTAWAGGGITAGDYTSASHAHGLATGFGDTASVGVGGLTLGGGFGYLSRKFGLAIDELLAAEVVTADGSVLHVDGSSHPDLFWAIRGGGGNFGVVTRFKFRLREVDTVFGGMLILPAKAQVIESFVAEAAGSPDELGTIANVMPAPPLPFLPSEHHGKLVVLIQMVYAGVIANGEKAVAPFRALGPIVDMLRPMPYPQIYPPEDPNFRPMGANRVMFLDGIDRAAAETIVDHLEHSAATTRVAQIRVLGGAIGRVNADATAFAHRSRPILVNVAALYGRADDAPRYRAWADAFRVALQRGTTGAYVNFLADDGPARIREAYPDPTWERLKAIKQRYDPANLFRLNQNVPPSAEIENAG